MNKLISKPLVTRLTLLSLVVAFLSGCGFQLRGSYAVPPHMQFICLDDGGQYNLGKALKSRLEHSNVSLIEDKTACVSLTVVDADIERRVLSLFPNAQVAEYELNYSVDYSIQYAGEAESRQFTTKIARDYQDDPDAVLAKSKEMKILLSELRRHAAEQIVLQLASLDNR